MSGGEILAARNTLEEAAATLLGRMLFEFARLDVALGMCIVCADVYRDREILMSEVSSLSFHKRLKSLNQFVETAFVEGSKKRTAYAEWIQRTRTMRLLRNDLVHGRWGIDPVPTASHQRHWSASIARAA